MFDVSAFLRLQELETLEKSYAVVRMDHDDIAFRLSQKRPLLKALAWNNDHDFFWNYTRYSRPIAKNSLRQIRAVSHLVEKKCDQIRLTSAFRDRLQGPDVEKWVDREDHALQVFEHLSQGLSCIFQKAVEYEEKRFRPGLLGVFSQHYNSLNRKIGGALTGLAEVLMEDAPNSAAGKLPNVLLETILQTDRRQHQLMISIGHGHLGLARNCHDFVAVLDRVVQTTHHAPGTEFGQFIRNNRAQTMDLAEDVLNAVEYLDTHLRRDLGQLPSFPAPRTPSAKDQDPGFPSFSR